MDKTAEPKFSEDAAAPTTAAPASTHVHKPLISRRMEWILGIGSGVAVGALSAAHSIRNKFYEDVKSWEGIPELRAARDKKLRAINGTEEKPKVFKVFNQEVREIEREFTHDLHKKIKAMSGIEMGGWRGMTIGTFQRFRVAGWPTKNATLFGLVTGAAIATSAIFSFDARRRIIKLADREDEKTPAR